MNKFKTLAMTALAAATFHLSSCDNDHDHKAPTVTINGPSGMFDSGDTVTLSVTFTDEHELHDYLVTVTREHDNTVVQTFTGHSHDKQYMMVRQFPVMTMEHSDFRIDAQADNHDGLTGTATAKFHVHPSEHQNEGPQITIANPSKMFHSKDQAQVNVTFEHTGHLHDVTVRITRQHDGEVVFLHEEHVHQSSYAVNETITLQTTEHSDFLIEAFTTNHSGTQTAMQTSTFHVHPH